MTNPKIPVREWLSDPACRTIIELFQKADAPIRFVGGVVRDALLKRPVQDFDLATPLLPDAVLALAEEAGVKAVPTGIDHGTVTLVAGGKPFEVTSLRRDMETDGRRAVVTFTEDWAEDAARRDFTINALYADPDGQVYDYFNGLADLEAKILRFIGDPAGRIKEDYLRIMRLFRFYAQFDGFVLDETGLAACRDLKDGLAGLSAERVQAEFLKLLTGRRAFPTLETMIEIDLLHILFPESPDLMGLRKLEKRELELDQPDAIRRLYALFGDASVGAAKRLRCSRQQIKRLEALAADDGGAPLAEALYDHGPQHVKDLALLGKMTVEDFAVLDRYERPVFPITGKDLSARGVEQGPGMGDLLYQVERWWIAEGFPDRKACLARLDGLIEKAV